MNPTHHRPVNKTVTEILKQTSYTDEDLQIAIKALDEAIKMKDALGERYDVFFTDMINNREQLKAIVWMRRNAVLDAERMTEY